MTGADPLIPEILRLRRLAAGDTCGAPIKREWRAIEVDRIKHMARKALALLEAELGRPTPVDRGCCCESVL